MLSDEKVIWAAVFATRYETFFKGRQHSAKAAALNAVHAADKAILTLRELRAESHLHLEDVLVAEEQNGQAIQISSVHTE